MNKQQKTPLADKVTVTLAILLILLSSLHVTLSASFMLVTLEFLSIITLFVVIWSGLYVERTYPWIWFYVVVGILLSVAYIIPYDSFSVLSSIQLPGRELYAQSKEYYVDQTNDGQVRQYLSLIPYQSILSLLALLPPLAMFFCAISLPERQLRMAVFVLIAIAAVMSVMGLVQYATGNPLFFPGNIPVSKGIAKGLFLNRDHFAGLLVMVLPITIALLLHSVGGGSSGRHHSHSAALFNATMIFAFVAILIFLAAVFTKSRAGVFLVMLATLLSSFVFSRHVGGKQTVGFAAIFSTIAIGLSVSIGLIPVLNRFVSRNPIEDERFRIFKHTIEGAQSFFPIGSGPGTFPDVYRAFQPIEQLKFINQAHNDYLQLVFEMGVIGIAVIAGFLICYIVGWFKLRGRKWSQTHFIQVGAGLGVFMILLHCSVEFILHGAMNTMIFAFLAGIFFRRSGESKVFGG